MSSIVDICNRALDKLGEAPITSLADDTKPARACNRAFEPLRDAVLRDHPWNFAMARAALAASTTAPAWGYAAQYTLPVDCLRVVTVDTTWPWTVEGGAILTDAGAPLYIRYVRRQTDASQFDPLFAEALAARLAVELCEGLTQSNTKREAATRSHREIMARARAIDGREASAETIADTAWFDARR